MSIHPDTPTLVGGGAFIKYLVNIKDRKKRKKVYKGRKNYTKNLIAEVQHMNDKNEKSSFWATLPGILTGIAAVIGAIATLYLALNQGIGPTPLMPDLLVSEFSLDPSIPLQGSPVSVRIGVYNQGTDRSGAFTVQWWADESDASPAHTWRVNSLAAGGIETLTYTYDGYPSWHGSLTTKVVVDFAGEVAESNEGNNEDRKTISVSPTPTPTPTTPLLPDLFVSEFSLDPSTPIQDSPVSVRVGVYNQGNDRSGAFTVQWWAGENYKEPACTWQVDSLAAQGERILTCAYDGYPSWYGSLTTKIVIDSAEEVAESNEGNNVDKMTISVSPKS